MVVHQACRQAGSQWTMWPCMLSRDRTDPQREVLHKKMASAAFSGSVMFPSYVLHGNDHGAARRCRSRQCQPLVELRLTLQKLEVEL